jgi:hypothetical protein
MRNKSLFTDRTEYCFICNKPAHGVHHLLFGKDRQKADEDGVYFPICDECHIISKYRIHDNPTAEALSKMLGETMWLLSQVADEEQRDSLKIKFIQRYGRSYL